MTAGRKAALLQSVLKELQPGATYISLYDLLQRSALHQGDGSHGLSIPKDA